MHVSTGQWRALKHVTLVGRTKDLLKALGNSVAVQRRWIRGRSSHPGNERADAPDAGGADGLTKLLPVFTATPAGPRRPRLAAKTTRGSSTTVPGVEASIYCS